LAAQRQAERKPLNGRDPVETIEFVGPGTGLYEDYYALKVGNKGIYTAPSGELSDETLVTCILCPGDARDMVRGKTLAEALNGDNDFSLVNIQANRLREQILPEYGLSGLQYADEVLNLTIK